jgi:hypothetical protein
MNVEETLPVASALETATIVRRATSGHRTARRAVLLGSAIGIADGNPRLIVSRRAKCPKPIAISSIPIAIPSRWPSRLLRRRYNAPPQVVQLPQFVLSD